MKVTIAETTKHVCDLCSRGGYLETCRVCGREFCLTCQGMVNGSWGFTTLCRTCAECDDVQKICERYATKLTPIFKNRDAALKRLGRKKTAKPKGGEA